MGCASSATAPPVEEDKREKEYAEATVAEEEEDKVKWVAEQKLQLEVEKKKWAEEEKQQLQEKLEEEKLKWVAEQKLQLEKEKEKWAENLKRGHEDHELAFDDLHFQGDLGRGAFGMVRRAIYRGAEVAVKTVQSETDDAIRDFAKEVDFNSKLPPHPNSVKVLGYTSSPNLSIVMELYPLLSVETYLFKNRNEISFQTLLNIAIGSSAGVINLHSQGFIHRDIAARNFLLQTADTCVVCDFGLSLVLPEGQDWVQQSMEVRRAEMLPVNMSAPEQLSGGRHSKASEVYMFGMYLWELCERRGPWVNDPDFQAIFEAPDQDAVQTREEALGYSGMQDIPTSDSGDLYYKTLDYSDDVEDTNKAKPFFDKLLAGGRPSLRPSWPSALQQLIRQCWHEDPSVRPTMEEVNGALRNIDPSQPVPEYSVDQHFEFKSEGNTHWNQHFEGEWLTVCKSLPQPLSRISVTANCRDQGWGNAKGQLFLVVKRGDATVFKQDLFGIVGHKSQQFSRAFEMQDGLVTKQGDRVALSVYVGQGGGHQLYVNNLVVSFDCAELPVKLQRCMQKDQQNSVKALSFMQKLSLPDSSFTANGSWNNDGSHGPHLGQLNKISGPGLASAWCAEANHQTNWVQIDLGAVYKVQGVATQGRGDCMQWVTEFDLAFAEAKDAFGPTFHVKRGNYDCDSIVCNTLQSCQRARYVRVTPLAWYGHVSMRWGVWGESL